MPVPVSVTNPLGKGITAVVQTSADTDGPFARLKRQQQQQQAAAQQQDSVQANGDAHVAVGNGTAAAEALQAPLPTATQLVGGATPAHVAAPAQPALEVNNLSFAYPGLGA